MRGTSSKSENLLINLKRKNDKKTHKKTAKSYFLTQERLKANLCLRTEHCYAYDHTQKQFLKIWRPLTNPSIVGILWALAPKVGIEKSTSVQNFGKPVLNLGRVLVQKNPYRCRTMGNLRRILAVFPIQRRTRINKT